MMARNTPSALSLSFVISSKTRFLSLNSYMQQISTSIYTSASSLLLRAVYAMNKFHGVKRVQIAVKKLKSIEMSKSSYARIIAINFYLFMRWVEAQSLHFMLIVSHVQSMVQSTSSFLFIVVIMPHCQLI